MVNPFLVKNAAKAAAGAKSAAATTKIAMTEKAAKGFAGATRSMEEVTKLGGFEKMESMFNSISQAGPGAVPMQVLSAQFDSATMESRVDLVISLIGLINSDSFQSGLKAVTDTVNFLADRAKDLVDVATNAPHNRELPSAVGQQLVADMPTYFIDEIIVVAGDEMEIRQQASQEQYMRHWREHGSISDSYTGSGDTYTAPPGFE